MVINYQDNNLIVMYLQVYLAEKSGLTLRRVVPRSKRQTIYYEVTQNDPLIVTGYYNIQTYSAIALYMAYNYPNEGYPFKWTVDKVGNWTKEDYVYDGDYDELVKIISSNMEAVPYNKDVIQIPERVLSYVFEEVVTPISPPEEILRVKQLMYDFIYADSKHPHPLTYTDELTTDVMNIQRSIVDKYTLEYGNSVQIIVMDYKKDNEGDDIITEPILTYNIGGQLSRVVASTFDKITGSRITSLVTKTDSKTLKVNISADNLTSASYLYEVEGETVMQEATGFTKLDNYYWVLQFDEDIGDVTTDCQLNLSYEESFVYNILTGDITFNDFEKGKEIIVNKYYSKEMNYPENLIGFKVTGYVDPWTEIIIKKGYEDRDG